MVCGLCAAGPKSYSQLLICGSSKRRDHEEPCKETREPNESKFGRLRSSEEGKTKTTTDSLFTFTGRV